MNECEAEGPWGRCEEYKGHDRWPDREREHVVYERGVNWSTEHRWWGPVDLNEPQLIGLEYLEKKFRDRDQPPPVPPLKPQPHLTNLVGQGGPGCLLPILIAFAVLRAVMG